MLTDLQLTWLLIPQASKDAQKGKILADFLTWMVNDGQKMVPIFVCPVPASVAEK